MFGPVPTNAAQRESEVAALVEKSVRGELNEREDARLNELLAARVESEQAAEEQALAAYRAARRGRGGPPPAALPQNSGELKRLVARSLEGTLTPAESARYSALIEAQLIAAGEIEAPASGGDTADFDATDSEIDAAFAATEGTNIDG